MTKSSPCRPNIARRYNLNPASGSIARRAKLLNTGVFFVRVLRQPDILIAGLKYGKKNIKIQYFRSLQKG